MRNLIKVNQNCLILYFLISIISTHSCLFANNQTENDIFFEAVSSGNGLSSVLVNSIIQDRKGFIWVATEDGLNKYNGYEMEIFLADKQNSVSDNFTLTLFCDSEGLVWVGTSSGGVNSFNPETEIYTHYRHKRGNPNSVSSDVIRTIAEDSNNNLWIGTDGGGLNKFIRGEGSFFTPEILKKLPKLVIVVSPYLDKLLIGTDKGLFLYDESANKLSEIDLPLTQKGTIATITALAVDKFRNQVFVGTDGGLFVLDKNMALVKSFYADGKKNSIPNNFIGAIVFANKDDLWVGTRKGLSVINLQQHKVKNYKRKPGIEGTLSNNFVRTVLKDKDGNMWLGTLGGGVNKYSPHKKRFYKLAHDPEKETSFSHNMTRSIYEDSDGTVWTGTMGGGLNAFVRNKNGGLSFNRSFEYLDNLSSSAITAIYEDENKTLWVGSWGDGIYRFDDYRNRLTEAQRKKQNPSFRKYQHNDKLRRAIGSNIIQAIKEDSHGNLWIGTEYGLDIFDREKDEFVHYRHDPFDPKSISNNRIQSNCIYEDVQGNLWIGTWDGLNKVSKNSLKYGLSGEIKFSRYKYSIADTTSLHDSRVISIYQNIDGIIWIGTYGGGLNKMEVVKTDTGNATIFTNYTERDGLKSDVIYGIQGDSRGNLWLSTTNGLSMFNPFTEEVVNYSKIDGLQSNQFYWGASCKARDGILFFGGINGLNYFKPEDLKDNQNTPDVYLTGFNLSGRRLKGDGTTKLLNKSILDTRKIELSYDQNVFTLEFVALDYTIPEKNQYEYMLEGYNKQWIKSGVTRTATYNLAEPGEYRFRVRASNNDLIWNNEGAELSIIMHPPFWKTIWFIILLVLFVGGMVFYAVYSYIRQLLAIERLRAKLAADLHDSIGASLTEISILSEVIGSKLKDKSEEVNNNLKLISNKSRHLVDEMSDIVWLVNPKRDSLYDLILRLEDTYSEILSYKGISFRSSNLKSLEKVSLSMEQRQNLFLIFKEAINNSITHSNCSDIYLHVTLSGKKLKMELDDNGDGFDSEKKDEVHKGNGMENMFSRAETLGANLTVESEPGKGTKIIYNGFIN